MIGSIKAWLFHKLKSTFLSQNYKTPFTTIDLGLNCSCYGNYYNGEIKVGDYAQIRRSELHGAIRIGRFSSLNGPNLDIYAGQGEVRIGNFCSIARNVSFQVDNHNYHKLSTYLLFKNVFHEENSSEILAPGNINVGHDVWIGSHAIILGNVTVGNGAVIAANSVVNKDVPPFAIVAGSPARIIKYRFNEKTIRKITQMAWWNWPIEKIKEHKWLFEDELNAQMLMQLK